MSSAKAEHTGYRKDRSSKAGGHSTETRNGRPRVEGDPVSRERSYYRFSKKCGRAYTTGPNDGDAATVGAGPGKCLRIKIAHRIMLLWVARTLHRPGSEGTRGAACDDTFFSREAKQSHGTRIRSRILAIVYLVHLSASSVWYSGATAGLSSSGTQGFAHSILK